VNKSVCHLTLAGSFFVHFAYTYICIYRKSRKRVSNDGNEYCFLQRVDLCAHTFTLPIGLFHPDYFVFYHGIRVTYVQLYPFSLRKLSSWPSSLLTSVSVPIQYIPSLSLLSSLGFVYAKESSNLFSRSLSHLPFSMETETDIC
jgi:hypothetical protein